VYIYTCIYIYIYMQARVEELEVQVERSKRHVAALGRAADAEDDARERLVDKVLCDMLY
jgi:hypothetical protein